MIKVSVVVPVYNAEKDLHRCVDSILAQNYIDFELLLIDDGSKDNSGIICDEYAAMDLRVRAFHKENGGVSSARNLGLDNAKGEWIAFCDADDYVEPLWLSTYMENAANVDLVIQGYNNDVELSNTNFDFEGSVHDIIEKLFVRHILGYLHTKIFRNSMLKMYQIRFDESVRFREDEDFVLKYLRFVSMVKCVSYSGYSYIRPNLLAKYYDHDNFNVSLSMYNSIIQIYGDEHNNVTCSYLLNLINSYFYSFRIQTDCQVRTKVVKRLIGKRVLYLDSLSFISRIILYYFPSYLTCKIFKIKAMLYK